MHTRKAVHVSIIIIIHFHQLRGSLNKASPLYSFYYLCRIVGIPPPPPSRIGGGGLLKGGGSRFLLKKREMSEKGVPLEMRGIVIQNISHSNINHRVNINLGLDSQIQANIF